MHSQPRRTRGHTAASKVCSCDPRSRWVALTHRRFGRWSAGCTHGRWCRSGDCFRIVLCYNWCNLHKMCYSLWCTLGPHTSRADIVCMASKLSSSWPCKADSHRSAQPDTSSSRSIADCSSWYTEQSRMTSARDIPDKVHTLGSRRPLVQQPQTALCCKL